MGTFCVLRKWFNTSVFCAMSRPRLPIDHGWAWMVMLGALINTSCSMIFMRSTSVLFIAFMDKYKASATLTTLAFSLFAVTFAVSSFLQPIIFLTRFTIRALTLTGSILNVSALIGLAFSSSILMASGIQVIIGFACGFLMVPQMSLVGRYFKKRLSLAASVAALGFSIATMAGPALTQFLLDEYGLKGGLILLAAVNLHCILGSMLLRPVSFYAEDSAAPDMIECDVTTPSQSCVCSCMDIQKNKTLKSEKYQSEPCSAVKQIDTLIQKYDGKINNVTIPKLLRYDGLIAYEIQLVEGKQLSLQENICDEAPSLLVSSVASLPNIGFLDRLSRSTSTMYLSNSTLYLALGSQPTYESCNTQYKMCSCTCSSTCSSSTSEDHEILHKNIPCGEVTLISKRPAAASKRSETASSFPFKNPYVILLIFASGIGVHGPAYYSYAPVLGKENGLTKDQIPYLLTVAGLCDLICKISIGLIADHPYVRKIYLVAVIQFLFGITLQFVSFFQGMYMMVLLQVIGGICVQVLVTLLPAITAELIGPEYIGHIMSGYYLVNGAVSMLDHILVGIFRDLTGSYTPVFNYMGVLYLVGFILLILVPLISRKS